MVSHHKIHLRCWKDLKLSTHLTKRRAFSKHSTDLENFENKKDLVTSSRKEPGGSLGVYAQHRLFTCCHLVKLVTTSEQTRFAGWKIRPSWNSWHEWQVDMKASRGGSEAKDSLRFSFSVVSASSEDSWKSCQNSMRPFRLAENAHKRTKLLKSFFPNSLTSDFRRNSSCARKVRLPNFADLRTY